MSRTSASIGPAGGGLPAARAGVPPDRRWLILGTVGLAQLMVVLDVTIVNVALPSAQRALGFPTVDRQWVVTAYALAFGSLLLFGAGAVICGTLFRPGPLRASGPAPAIPAGTAVPQAATAHPS